MTTDVRPEKSTTVRVFRAPTPVRAAFAVLNRLAPGMAARWAERIWFTLPRAAPPAEPAPGGRTFTVRAGDRVIAGRTWGEGPAVYLLHGWGGHSGQFGALVGPLVERGFRVVAPDAPSHGGSAPGAYGPRSSSIPEFTAALTAVVAEAGPAHAIVAHSLGATAAAVALCDGLPADRVVLLAPMAGPQRYAGQLATALGLTAGVRRRLVARVERRVGVPMRHFEVPEMGRAVTMPPTLVVHDRLDAYTPIVHGREIAAAWPTARLSETTGLGHRRLLRDPAVIDEVTRFVAG